jgi:ATP-dependent Lon protease
MGAPLQKKHMNRNKTISLNKDDTNSPVNDKKAKTSGKNTVQQEKSRRQGQSKSDQMIEEIELLQQKVDQSSVPPKLNSKLDRMIDRLRRMAQFGSYSGEFEVINKYVDWTTGVPWGHVSQDQIELERAKRIMDKHHYGMDSVKNLVLDYLAVMKLHLSQDTGQTGQSPAEQAHPEANVQRNMDKNAQANTDKNAQTQPTDYQTNDMSNLEGSSSHAPIICFVGLQGVGKTTMAKSIAKTLGRKFSRISLGALGSVTQLRGQSRAYLDAEPGQIVKSLVRVGTMNPVILLDEIDKVSGKKGLLNDVMAALLEILDPEQNSTFVDHYIDYPIDLSRVMFICTANNLGTLSAALLDRLEVIRFTSYTDEEKVVIAKDYLLPKVLESTGLRNNQLIIEDDVWPQVVRPLGFDAGIRQLERNLTSLARHAARYIVEGNQNQVRITLDNVKEFLPEGIGTLS